MYTGRFRILKTVIFTLEDMDWNAHAQEIQAHYFRPGPRAYLWINQVQGCDLLTWSFTFMDFGMYHTVSGHASVTLSPSGDYAVDGMPQVSLTHALDTVFDGHYPRFLADLYRDLQVQELQIGP
jgi:hypothetical protein